MAAHKIYDFSPQKQNLLKNKSKATVEKISAAFTQIG